MERYENIVKIEEMRKLAENNQYIKAVKILDTMDISKIKALTDLSIIADIYMQNGRYDEAMTVLTKIYGKTKTRRVLYQLVDLSIKRGSVPEAEDYLERYIKVAPQDSSRFIFRYLIDKLKGGPYEVLIASLERLKEFEYYEIWAYELAKLYHKAGMKDKCVRECSDIILWFGDGIYVEKAKLLKGYYVGEINPIHMLKAKEKMEAEKKLGMDKTKDFSAMRSQIDHFLAEEGTVKEYLPLEESDSFEEMEEIQSEPPYADPNKIKSFVKNTYHETDIEEEDMVRIWNEHESENGIFDNNMEQESDAGPNTLKADFQEDTEEIYEDILNKDPAMEEFFKIVAKKLEKEIVAGKEIAAEREIATESEIAAGKEITAEKEIAAGNEVAVGKEITAGLETVKEDLLGEASIVEEAVNITDSESDITISKESVLADHTILEVMNPEGPVDEAGLRTRPETEIRPEIKVVKITSMDLSKMTTDTIKVSGLYTGAEEVQELEPVPEFLSENELNIVNEENVKAKSYETTAEQEDKTIHSEGYMKQPYEAGKYDSIFSEAGMNYEKDFGYFICIDSLRKQIESCLENILSDYTNINHMIITGERKSGKTTLAKKISKALYGLNWINTNRVAKISASKLNGISLKAKKDKLVNSSLIIEEAGLLDTEAADQLISLIEELSGNIFVILEDNETSINKLLSSNQKLKEVFSSTIELPKYSTGDLFGFAFTYINNNDYEFTRDVKTAFEKEIKRIVASVNEENQLEAVMDLARRTKNSADERNKLLLSDIIRARDLSSDDFLYIKTEDFLWEDSMNG